MKTPAAKKLSDFKFDAKNNRYVLRLYVTGATSRSRQAILNLNAICSEYLKGQYDLQVIDIHQKPTLAKDEQIVAAPTLVKKLPVPMRRIIGDLSDKESVLLGLDLKRKS
jgi:circadian clock protein KaiB